MAITPSPSLAELLNGHVSLDIECFDRLYPERLPAQRELQTPGASSTSRMTTGATRSPLTLSRPMEDAYRKAVTIALLSRDRARRLHGAGSRVVRQGGRAPIPKGTPDGARSAGPSSRGTMSSPAASRERLGCPRHAGCLKRCLTPQGSRNAQASWMPSGTGMRIIER